MNNPYAPPAGAEQTWDPQGPSDAGPPGVVSAVPKVFGVLSITFASIQLLLSLFSACGSAFGRSLGGMGNLANTAKVPHMKVMFEHMATIYNYMLIQSLLFVVLSAMLLAIGIGQLKYRAWARAWTVYWALAAMVALVIILAISFAVVGPLYQKMFEAVAKASPSGAIPGALTNNMSALFGGSLGVVYLIFYSPYPILLLLFFTKPRVKQAMDN